MSVKITPKPKFKLQGVNFVVLEPKDCFIWNDNLMMKLTDDCDGEDNSQIAVNLVSGDLSYDMCGEYVRPVDVEIKWKRKDI